MNKMKIQTYQVDTFTETLFAGNAAMVCVLEEWLPESMLQAIAEENNQPATAFLVKDNEKYHIRWLSPEYEIPLCGHGSVAAAWVVFNILEPRKQSVEFVYPKGTLNIRHHNGAIVLDFPAHQSEVISTPSRLVDGLGVTPIECYGYKTERCLAVLSDENQVKNLNLNMNLLKELDYRSVVVTASSKEYDFISRVFYPQKAMSEDAVTGSAHCLLVPYWAQKLDKALLHAYQASPRGGSLICEMHHSHISISGKAVLYMQGILVI